MAGKPKPTPNKTGNHGLKKEKKGGQGSRSGEQGLGALRGQQGRRDGAGQAKRRVAILLADRTGYKAGVLRGIISYARQGGNWSTWWLEPEPGWPQRMVSWAPDGLIADLYGRDILRDVQGLGLPVVSLSNNMEVPGVPRVGLDNFALGRCAGEYFLERKFSNLACVSGKGRWWASLRRDGFREVAAQAGRPCFLYEHLCLNPKTPGDDRLGGLAGLKEWLSALPLPAALFAVSDRLALSVMALAGELGMGIPYPLAIAGAENNEILCSTIHPPLSSIQVPAEAAGFRAATELESLFQGHPGPSRAVLFPPTRMVTRQSSDILAIMDPDIAAAVRFIHEHSGHFFHVTDILKAIPMSRSLFEKRFKAILGCSPLQEIQRAHIERAKQLLEDTSLTMPQIAQASGFTSAIHLSALFCRRTGRSPAQYRKECRMRLYFDSGRYSFTMAKG